MKTYDHEPTLYELANQLEEEYAYVPGFIPDIKIPILGKIIKKKITQGMTASFINFLIS